MATKCKQNYLLTERGFGHTISIWIIYSKHILVGMILQVALSHIDIMQMVSYLIRQAMQLSV